MITTMKAEFRKLLTVRSTYFMTALAAGLIIFVAFYLTGWRLTPDALHDPNQLASDVTGALNVTIFGAIVGVLLMTHEYRYNTIMYTLTSSNSRTKVLLSKIVVISVYGVVLALIVGLLSPTMSYLGVHLHGHTLVPQTLHYGDLLWRSVFYGWGYAMAGLLLAALTRNQVASIVSLFILPSLAESLLSLLLKHNSIYLPFAALSQVIGTSGHNLGGGALTPGRGALVFSAYLVVGWIVALILFLRREAN